MSQNYTPLYIALRYLRGRKSGFLSFISALAFISTSLGVAVLIIVSSVMNGFEKELKDRVLNVIPHASIYGLSPIDNWKVIEIDLKNDSNVKGISPYIETEALIKSKSAVAGVLINGVIASKDKSVSVIHEFMQAGSFENIQKNNNIVLGRLLARKLNVDVGDKISLMLPDNNSSFAGYFPRSKVFNISGIFNVGSKDIDQTLAYISLENAAALTGLGNQINGFRLRFGDLFDAPYLVWQSLVFAEKNSNVLLNAEDWSYTYGPLFEAIMMEKSLVFLLLTLIIVVAAFNIVSMLMTMINEKRGAIAILQTMGMGSNEIFKIFLYLGILIALIGTFLGYFSG
jgi:lipoprotein-releasing system permease protein